jgi:hypothetical protein
MYTLRDYDEHRKTGFHMALQGVITDIEGNTYSYDATNVVQSSAKLQRNCTSNTAIQIGSVESSYFTVTLQNTSIDRYKLYSTTKYGKISLTGILINDGGPIVTSDGDRLTTSDGAHIMWDSDEFIPFGTFNITETARTRDAMTITAYDNMVLFGKEIDTTDASMSVSKTAYNWLKWLCFSCNVPLGTTEAEIMGMGNGQLVVDLDMSHCDDIKTYRDILSHLATFLGGVAVIDRYGQLFIKQYSRGSYVTEYGAADRYTSTIADYVTRYSGVYFTYATNDASTDEYYHTSTDSYLKYTVGTNAFLQISDSTVRATACQNIVNALANAQYVPFNITTLGDPCIDPMDVVHLKDNQMTDYDIAVITNITYTFNSKSTLICSGKNPLLDQSETKTDKIASQTAKRTNNAVDKSTLVNSISEAAKAITGNNGGFYRVWNNQTHEPDNPNETLWMMDDIDPYLSSSMWIANSNGIGHTTKYTDPTAFNVALTNDGFLNANALRVGIIRSTAQGEDGSYWNLETGVLHMGLTEYFSVQNGTVVLGNSNFNTKMVLTSTKLSFMSGTNEVAYISNEMLHIAKGEVFNEFIIDDNTSTYGSWHVRMRPTNGHLSLNYVS